MRHVVQLLRTHWHVSRRVPGRLVRECAPHNVNIPPGRVNPLNVRGEVLPDGTPAKRTKQAETPTTRDTVPTTCPAQGQTTPASTTAPGRLQFLRASTMSRNPFAAQVIAVQILKGQSAPPVRVSYSEIESTARECPPEVFNSSESARDDVPATRIAESTR